MLAVHQFIVEAASIYSIIETMKNLIGTAVIGILLLMSAGAKAQQLRSSRTCLFNNFPPVIHCTALQLSSFFLSKQGEYLKVDLNDKLSISGIVKRRFTKFNNDLETVIIVLPAFNNILFSITKRKDAENIIVYSAHLFDNAYADGFQLKKTDLNHYELTKISREKLLPACSL